MSPQILDNSSPVCMGQSHSALGAHTQLVRRHITFEASMDTLGGQPLTKLQFWPTTDSQKLPFGRWWAVHLARGLTRYCNSLFLLIIGETEIPGVYERIDWLN